MFSLSSLVLGSVLDVSSSVGSSSSVKFTTSCRAHEYNMYMINIQRRMMIFSSTESECNRRKVAKDWRAVILIVVLSIVFLMLTVRCSATKWRAASWDSVLYKSR